MPRSMTGFGRSTTRDDDWTQTWEIRSVNSRHLDIKWRTPLFVRSQEPEWEKVVREYAARGRLEINLYVKTARPELIGMSLNQSLAGAMLAQLNDFATGYSLPFAPDINRFLNIAPLWEDDLREPDLALLARLTDGLRLALDDWNASRRTEGKAMAEDMIMRHGRLRDKLQSIRERTPQLREEKFAALQARIQNTLDKFNIRLEPERVLQEIALLSDRLDITEELTRLAAHLDRFSEILEQGGEVGKRLDFTLQECFREINTCGNKAQDALISRLTVDFKTELEKCRELVQNLE